MTWKRLSLSGWGRSRWAGMPVARPEGLAALAEAALTTDAGGVLARGAGRSYGDCALNEPGRLVLTERLNRLLEFDSESGLLVAEAGVTFEDLMVVFLPRGWAAPVTPGTAYVTLGGALANDVHGKNHDKAGSFGRHVEWFDLLVADGRMLRVSRQSHPALFDATVGGLGLTGIVVALCLRLTRVPSAAFAIAEDRAPDLESVMERLDRARHSASYSVAWVDGLASGAGLGRGVVETGEWASSGPAAPRRYGQRLSLPVDLPSQAMSPPIVAAFNHLYFHRIPAGGRRRVVGARTFLYPLDAIGGWNRLYGRAGFHQFQCAIPEAEAARALRRLLEAIAEARFASFLAVLKTLGDEGSGLLSFPLRGWTLALDFAARPGVADLLARLEAITLDHGGRLYLAKDSVMGPAAMARMYPRLERFRAVLAEIDPEAHWRSDMDRRLDIRGGAA